MAELNLKQIIDRLNEEFMGDTRKLVFWYDDKGEFAEDVQSIELANAKVYFWKLIISSIQNAFLREKIQRTIILYMLHSQNLMLRTII